MRHASWIALYTLAVVHWGTDPGFAMAAEDYEFHHENVLGTSLELQVRADSEEGARWAESRVLGEIERLRAIFSGYDKASEFSRWRSSAKVPTRVSPELFEVLQVSESWISRGDGSFDPRVEALTRLWSGRAKVGRLPTVDETTAARSLMTQPAWRLDAVGQTAERLSDCPLSLDGIAKGYIVERACDAALDRGRGVRGLLLNVGGDLRVRGEIEATIGIVSPWADSESSEPFTHIKVKDRSVATSGSSQRGFRIEGRWYSHIFDPRSGKPVDRVLAATVVSERSVDAEAFAKVCNVLAPEESLRLLGTLPGVECLIVARDGKVTRSDGWPGFEVPRPLPLAFADDKKVSSATKKDGEAEADAKAASSVPWNDDFALVVNFEINRPADDGGGRGYRRPYVAIWVEDKNGTSLRTLALWVSMGGSGPFQWLPDLKRWYVNDQARRKRDKTELIFTIARPTRPPGKYRVMWDGKDDRGKQLGGGDYIIFIEAAREHGTYQSIRQPVTLSDKPFTEELKGNVELKSASIEYRRKDPAK